MLAKRYGELIDDLWTGNSKSITPLKFRVSQLQSVHVHVGKILILILKPLELAVTRVLVVQIQRFFDFLKA